jgi:hypothetical protein
MIFYVGTCVLFPGSVWVAAKAFTGATDSTTYTDLSSKMKRGRWTRTDAKYARFGCVLSGLLPILLQDAHP